MKKQGYFLTLLSAVIFGLTPTLAKITYQLGNNGITMAFLRHLIVIPILWIMIKIKGYSLKITRKQLKEILCVGIIGNALTVILLYTSYSYIGVGSATVLHFMYPLFVCLIYYFYYHQPLGKATLLCLLLATVGITFFIEFNQSSFLGMIMALTSGVFFAYYIVGVDKKRLGSLNPYVLNFYFAISIAGCILLIGGLTRQIQWVLPLKVYGYALVIAILTSIIAIICLQQGIKYIGGSRASIISMFEPVTSVIFGCFILKEQLTILKIIGSILILGSILYMIIKEENHD